MAVSHTLRFPAAAAAVLLLSACDDLLPARPQAAPPPPSSADTAARTPRPARRTPADTREEATGAEAEAAFNQIRRSLRILVAAEQGFYAENGTYSEDLARIGYRTAGESQVRFLWLTRQGWAASGTHPALPGRDCVTFVGEAHAPPTTLKLRRSGREGVVVCDAQPQARPIPGAGTPPQPRAAPPAPVPDTGSALDAVSPTVQMKVDLRNLVRAQTAYFGTQGLYSRRPEQLQLQFGYRRGVNITVLHADQRSWAARATHSGTPGKSCVVWYGSPPVRPSTLAARRVPPQPGVPACDD